MSITKMLGQLSGTVGLGGLLGGAATGGLGGAVVGGTVGGLGYGAAKMTGNRTFQMYAGGAAIGAGAGGLAGMMGSGEIEGGVEGAFKGAMAGAAGGGAVRSLTTRGGFLNTAGQMLGRSFDDAGSARLDKQLTAARDKYSKMSSEAEGYADAGKLVTDLEAKQAQGGGMTKFFSNLAETGEERARRQGTEYFNLNEKAMGGELSNADAVKYERMQRQWGDTADLDALVMKQGTNKPIRSSSLRGVDLNDASYNPSLHDDGMGGVATFVDDLVMNEGGGAKIAGYAMHKSLAKDSINSRNGAMIMGGAGLTGGMMGLSHSRNRRSKKRGFNSKRGSRF